MFLTNCQNNILCNIISTKHLLFPRSLGIYKNDKTFSTKCNLEEKVFLVTGATDGIGKHTATKLANTNAKVLLHGRNPKRGEDTLKEIKKLSGNDRLEYFNADLSSMRDIRKLAAEIHSKHSRVDCLINNAGVYKTKKLLSADGFEMTWAVNVIAPFMLTSLLLDLVRASPSPRIVNVSSISQSDGGGELDFDNLQQEKGPYNAYHSYGLSKLCSVCFTYDLADRLKDEGITVNCLDPGTVNTKMLLAGWGQCGIPVNSADNEFYLATDKSVSEVTGKYFVSRRESCSCAITYDVDARKKLWEVLEKQTGIKY